MDNDDEKIAGDREREKNTREKWHPRKLKAYPIPISRL